MDYDEACRSICSHLDRKKGLPEVIIRKFKELAEEFALLAEVEDWDTLSDLRKTYGEGSFSGVAAAYYKATQDERLLPYLSDRLRRKLSQERQLQHD